MKRQVRLLAFVLLIAMTFSGCVMRTVDELYCLPKRTQANNDLQAVIDNAMANLTYCPPLSGENRQTVQPVDLDGDGVDEYVVLAKNNAAEPLKILVFCQNGTGYALMDTISAYGFAFDSIEFTNVDDHPGAEIIGGRQVDGAVRSVAVYSLYTGFARLLLEANYSKMLACDMDLDGRSELMLLPPSLASERSCTAVLYRYLDGQLEISSKHDIPYALSSIEKMESVTLRDGIPAMMITSVEKNLKNTDLFVMRSKRFVHIYGPAATEKLNDRFVPNMDVDLDGDIDIPELIPMTVPDGTAQGGKWVLWYDVSSDGSRHDGMFSYFNFEDKWYLHLDSRWVDKLTVTRGEGVCTFLDANGEMVLSIYVLTGDRRYEQAEQMGATVVGNNGMVLFAAKLGLHAEDYGITAQRLPRMFYTLVI